MKHLKRFSVLLILCTAVMISITGCQKKSGKKPNLTTAETESVNKPEYNASDVAVVVKKDMANGRISLKSSQTGAIYSVNYNGGTKIKSKYDNDMLMDNISVGMIVEVHYIQGTQKLVELKITEKAWENTSVVRWDVNYDKKIITIGSQSYAYDENLFIDSNGKSVDIREISGIDELTVRGVGTKVLSVVVNKGHGYIRLKNEANYVGGLIEVGNKIMTAITENMIIAAPEGEYKITVSKNGIGGEKTVTVTRGIETIVSLADFEQPVERIGSVKFIISPQNAVLYVDGVKTSYDELVTMSYGTHSIKITAEDYDTYTETMTISSAYTTLNVNLGDEDETESETAKGEEELDEGDEVIKVQTPQGASVYFDGVYKGVAPVEFKKVSGEHVIILRKTGYETKMYTIDVVSDGEDMIINLPDMLQSE